MKMSMALIILTSLALTSCAAIEEATSKWKTPDSPGVGLSEGEKSSYLTEKENSTQTKKPATKSKEKTKKK